MSDGFAYLEALRKQADGAAPGFSSFAMYLEQKARKQGIPLSGQFELTPLCNLNCRMCYVHLTGEQMPHPLLTAEQWNGLISQACRAGMLRATLTGGECLSYPGFQAVYEHLQSEGCEVTVMTNGTLLDERWMDFFLRHRPGLICVTLYGDSEDAYERVTGQRAFKTTVSHIRALREAKLPLQISVTPNRLLGEDVYGTIRLARELCPSIRVNASLTQPRPETGRADQVTDLDDEAYIRIFRFRNELNGIVCKEFPADQLPKPGGPRHEGKICGLLCGGGRSSFSIDWQGVMSPCNELEMVRAFPFRDGFEQAWQFIHQAAEQWPRAIECDGCAYSPVCEKCAGKWLQFSKPGVRSPALCERTMHYVQQGIYSIPECN